MRKDYIRLVIQSTKVGEKLTAKDIVKRTNLTIPQVVGALRSLQGVAFSKLDAIRGEKTLWQRIVSSKRFLNR